MNTYNKYIISGLMLLIALTANAQSQLNKYLEIATKNNPELKMAFNEYMAALQKVSQVKALPNPTVAFAYLLEPVETRMGPQEYKIGISQMFPWFGTLKSKGNSATEAAKAKYEIFLDVKSDVYNKVKNTYYNLYFNNKSALITAENIRLLSTIQKLALIKVEAGTVSAVDEYRIEMELNDLKNLLSTINNNKIVLQTKFKKLLNSDNNIIIHSPELLWENDFKITKENLLDSIKSGNHKLLSINMQISALKEKQVVAKKSGMPGFTIGADYISVGTGDMNLPGDDAIVLPKIGINIPLYRGKYKALEKEAYYNELAKKEQQINVNNMLDILFEKVWKDYKDAKDKMLLYKSQIHIAKKSLAILESSYAADNNKFEEYIRMERQLLRYSLSLEKARINKHKAISYIEYMMGK